MMTHQMNILNEDLILQSLFIILRNFQLIIFLKDQFVNK